MKPKYNYHSELSEVVIDALLHLYLKINASSRFVPLSTRNKILKDWLEPKVKSIHYKGLKKELQILVRIAKKGGDVEAKLLDINEENKMLVENFSDADKLYIYFKALKEKFGYSCLTMPKDGTNNLEANALYMSESELEDGLGQDNKLYRDLKAIIILKGGVDEFLHEARSVNDIFSVKLDYSEGETHHLLININAL